MKISPPKPVHTGLPQRTVYLLPDTSPRGDDVPDDDAYDFGKGAGFYINATRVPWNTHYQWKVILQMN